MVFKIIRRNQGTKVYYFMPQGIPIACNCYVQQTTMLRQSKSKSVINIGQNDDLKFSSFNSYRQRSRTIKGWAFVENCVSEVKKTVCWMSRYFINISKIQINDKVRNMFEIYSIKDNFRHLSQISKTFLISKN